MNKGAFNGKRILQESTIDLMLTDQMVDLNKLGMGESPNAGESFCLGSALITEANQHTAPHSIGTYSWGGYFNTKWFVNPQQELVFVGLTNVFPFSNDEFWNDMYKIIYSSLEKTSLSKRMTFYLALKKFPRKTEPCKIAPIAVVMLPEALAFEA